ncbi:carbohydrate binding domain-containing protein [Streptomyces sp. NPDC127110]|uniref:carbohydrate binding domain-containing protein n=1 Tax=Streptomyces sp. NPDC127110 TaxID=3345362 RepID=UPI0036430995
MTMRVALRCAFGFAPTALSVDWTDLSPWLDLPQKVRISRGAADELSQTQPSTMSFRLDNSDGRFTAGLASSPYYPYVRPNCPIQLGVLTTTSKNLTENPSFEDGLVAPWYAPAVSFAATLATDTLRAHSGTYSLKITWSLVLAHGGVIQHTAYGLTIGQTYTISGWVWVPTGDPAVRWMLDDTTLGTASSTTNAWEQISLTFTATSTSHTVQLTTSAAIATTGDVVWVDDIQLELGSSATSFDSNGARTHWRFYGMVNQWGAKWEGLHSTVSLTATDLFKHLGRLPQLSSLLTEEVLQLGPTVYYPLTEPSTSTSGGDIAGAGGGSMVSAQVGSGGTYTFGEQQGPAATEQTSISLAPAGAANGIRMDADMGTVAEDSTTDNWITVEAWFKTSTAGRTFLSIRSTSFQHQLVFGLNGSGYPTIQHTAVGGGLTTTVITSTNLADGAWHHLVYREEAATVHIDGGSAIAVSVSTMLALRYISIGSNSALWEGSVAHVALHTSTIASALLTGHYAAGATGFSGEDSDVRVMRLAGYAGIAAIDPAGDFSAVASQGAGGQSALEMMRQVEETEGGKLVSHRDGHALLFQSRTARYNAPTAVSLAYADLETDAVEVPIDDQKLVNTITANRPNGATQRVTAPSSIAAFGPYQRTSTILKTTDAEVVDAAYWTVSRYAVPQPELREVPVQAYTMPVATYRALLDADISSVLEITSLPAEAAASTISAMVEGYTEEIGQESHLISYHCSRAQTDAVWALDDASFSVLGTTTRLAY